MSLNKNKKTKCTCSYEKLKKYFPEKAITHNRNCEYGKLRFNSNTQLGGGERNPVISRQKQK